MKTESYWSYPHDSIYYIILGINSCRDTNALKEPLQTSKKTSPINVHNRDYLYWLLVSTQNSNGWCGKAVIIYLYSFFLIQYIVGEKSFSFLLFKSNISGCFTFVMDLRLSIGPGSLFAFWCFTLSYFQSLWKKASKNIHTLKILIEKKTNQSFHTENTDTRNENKKKWYFQNLYLQIMLNVNMKSNFNNIFIIYEFSFNYSTIYAGL